MMIDIYLSFMKTKVKVIITIQLFNLYEVGRDSYNHCSTTIQPLRGWEG